MKNLHFYTKLSASRENASRHSDKKRYEESHQRLRCMLNQKVSRPSHTRVQEQLREALLSIPNCQLKCKLVFEIFSLRPPRRRGRLLRRSPAPTPIPAHHLARQVQGNRRVQTRRLNGVFGCHISLVWRVGNTRMVVTTYSRRPHALVRQRQMVVGRHSVPSLAVSRTSGPCSFRMKSMNILPLGEWEGTSRSGPEVRPTWKWRCKVNIQQRTPRENQKRPACSSRRRC